MRKVIIFLSIFSCISICQINTKDVVHLKNGSIIKGMIMEQIPNESLKIQTSDGSLFVFKMEEVLKITKEMIEPESINNESDILHKMQINDLQSRKRSDSMGFIISYGLTIVGSLALGVDDMSNLFIPAIGPFLQIDVVNSLYYSDDDEQKRDKFLLLLAGSLQSGFLFDYLITSNKIKEMKKNYSISVIPNNNGANVYFSYSF